MHTNTRFVGEDGGLSAAVSARYGCKAGEAFAFSVVSSTSRKPYVILGHWAGLHSVVASYCTSGGVE
jgi:hypothetical protein